MQKQIDIKDINIDEKVINMIDSYLFEIEANEQNRIEIKQNFINKLKYNIYESNLYESDFNQLDAILFETIKISIEKECEMQDKLNKYNTFKKDYNKKIYFSIILGIILPLLSTGFVFDLKYKLIILLYIIFSVIVSSLYIIILEYINYNLKLELKIKE